ncbi:MAG: NAD(P)H-dependent oxidoreductase [Bacilli bacterium]|nr:NAD(P)H-dependent oxidoreductase [Bacilli bacterium]
MHILTIIGTPHKGNTRAIVDLFLNEFKEEQNSFEEVILPRDMENFCYGCANCILRGEDKCPHYNKMTSIVEKIEKADLLILATPVFAMSCSSGLKTVLDHLAYRWLVHRPSKSMFHKVGLIVTTAAGSGIRDTNKLLKNNMFYWGIPKIYKYSVTAMQMQGNYNEYPHKDRIINKIKKKTAKIKKSLKNRKISFKMRLFFNIFKMTQKKGWNPIDAEYWKKQGWLDGKRPY